eukprot:scaffold555_cov158-Skeletonema_menzelii.AAC.24
MPKYFVVCLEAAAKFELASIASLAAPSWDLKPASPAMQQHLYSPLRERGLATGGGRGAGGS